VFSAFFVVMAVYAWPFVGYVLVEYILSFGIILFISNYKISEKGIRLYYINMLYWENIESVVEKPFLGLPYLLIRRKKGFSWWLPLYFTGERPVHTAFEEWAPKDNPLNTYGQTKNT
jgi:hypothetical protein